MATGMAMCVDENIAPQPGNVMQVLDAKLNTAEVLKTVALQVQPAKHGQKRPASGDSHVALNTEASTDVAPVEAPPSKRQRLTTWLVDSGTLVLSHARPLGTQAALGTKEFATRSLYGLMWSTIDVGSFALKATTRAGNGVKPHAVKAAMAAMAASNGVKVCSTKALSSAGTAALACRKATVSLAKRAAARASSGAVAVPAQAASADDKVAAQEIASKPFLEQVTSEFARENVTEPIVDKTPDLKSEPEKPHAQEALASADSDSGELVPVADLGLFRVSRAATDAMQGPSELQDPPALSPLSQDGYEAKDADEDYVDEESSDSVSEESSDFRDEPTAPAEDMFDNSDLEQPSDEWQ